MQLARQQALDAVKIGDLIFATVSDGQERVMLVYKAEPHRLFARHITSGGKVEFRRDGRSRPLGDGRTCAIASIATLPANEYDVAIGLDHKMRNAKELTDLRLSRAEIDLLLTVHDFFKAHPLPD